MKLANASILLAVFVSVLCIVHFSPIWFTSINTVTGNAISSIQYLRHSRLLGSQPTTLSSHICRSTQNQQTKTQCAEQTKNRESYRPENSTIYHVYRHMKDPDIKYFHESKTDPHRDKRFPRLNRNANQADPRINKSRPEVLREIFRNWAGFTAERGLVYWIAHGLLLGWYWNNDLMPWDYDLDVQVTAVDLLSHYARHHDTLYKDRYLFDVNPHRICRLHQYDNVIDARFIDTLTGYYVDITGLAFNPKKNKLQCKSPHTYDVDAIFPLQSSTFIGTEVWVPNKVEPILAKEYSDKCMTRPTHTVSSLGRKSNYRFDDKAMKWIKEN